MDSISLVGLGPLSFAIGPEVHAKPSLSMDPAHSMPIAQ